MDSDTYLDKKNAQLLTAHWQNAPFYVYLPPLALRRDAKAGGTSPICQTLYAIMKYFEPSDEDWYTETVFYIVDINGTVKFGITSNWEKRHLAYKREIGNLELRILKQDNYDKRWKAELIEQIVKWRLRPWCINGRHEWIDAPIQLVVNCYLDTRDIITPEINKYEYIHKKGVDRWGYYKQIVDMTFDRK